MSKIDKGNDEQNSERGPSSRNLAGQAPRKDTQRETHEAVVKDADKTDVADRDRVHGQGKTVGLEK